MVARDGSVPAWPRSARICRVRQTMNVAVRDESSVASAIACSIAPATAGSARPAGLRRCVTRRSTSPGRPSACHRWRRCLTVEAETGLPDADSSAALACSRSRRLVRSTSYSGRGGVPAGMSGRVPSTTSMMWSSHHRARSTTSGGSPASPICGPGRAPADRSCRRAAGGGLGCDVRVGTGRIRCPRDRPHFAADRAGNSCTGGQAGSTS